MPLNAPLSATLPPFVPQPNNNPSPINSAPNSRPGSQAFRATPAQSAQDYTGFRQGQAFMIMHTASGPPSSPRSAAAAQAHAQAQAQTQGQPNQQQNLALPPGWMAEWSNDYGRYYFYNAATGQSTWDDPRGAGQAPMQQAQRQAATLQRTMSSPVNLSSRAVAQQQQQQQLQQQRVAASSGVGGSGRGLGSGSSQGSAPPRPMSMSTAARATTSSSGRGAAPSAAADDAETDVFGRRSPVRRNSVSSTGSGRSMGSLRATFAAALGFRKKGSDSSASEDKPAVVVKDKKHGVEVVAEVKTKAGRHTIIRSKKDVRKAKEQQRNAVATVPGGYDSETPQPEFAGMGSSGNLDRILVRAVYDFDPADPSNPDEMYLRAGDLIEVYEQGADGWWGGVCVSDGKQRFGLFPVQYVQLT